MIMTDKPSSARGGEGVVWEKSLSSQGNIAVRNSGSFSFTHSTEQPDQFTFEDKTLWQDTFATLYEFYQSNTFCDIEIHCGSRVLRCHRVVLACVSRYFRSKFLSNMSECTNNVVTINAIDEVAFNELVNFAYTAKITLTIQNVKALLSACLVLQMNSVARACCVFMASHLHASNCIGIRNFAEQHGQMDLVAKAEGFMIDNFADVQNSEEWNQVTLSCLLSIVSSPNLNIRSEKEVYEAIMKIKSDLAENKAFLPTLMSSIQLPLLPTPYLTSEVCQEERLIQDLECGEYQNEAMSYQISLVQVIPEIASSERVNPCKSNAGVIFCIGGHNAHGNPLRTAECYDLHKNQWFQVTEMSTCRRHVGVVTVGGKLYAVGGHDGSEHLKTGEVFDPQTKKWQPIAPMSKLRHGTALAYLNGHIYAVGGMDDKSHLNTVERYDPESDSWSMVQPLNFCRGGVAVVTYRWFMYAMGGNNGTASLESCECYNPQINKWTLIQPMNKRRAGAGVAELNGFLYVVGGFDGNSLLDCAEKYDPTNNTWTMVANMSCPRGGVGVAALGGKLYAVGGHDGTSCLNSVEEYDPETDRWIQVANIGTCRAGAGVAVVTCHCDDLKDITKLSIAERGFSAAMSTARHVKQDATTSSTSANEILTVNVIKNVLLEGVSVQIHELNVSLVQHSSDGQCISLDEQSLIELVKRHPSVFYVDKSHGVSLTIETTRNCISFISSKLFEHGGSLDLVSLCHLMRDSQDLEFPTTKRLKGFMRLYPDRFAFRTVDGQCVASLIDDPTDHA